MRFPPVNLVSKFNKSIIIQSPDVSEAQTLIDLKLSYLKNSLTIPMNPSEYSSDRADEEALIKRYNLSPNSTLLAAYSDGEMIGNLDITGNPRERMAHTAMLGMGISNEWQNRGIGSLLMEQALEFCKNNSRLEIIWLDVYASNKAGLGLYKKMRFTISGTIPKFFKHENAYYDKIQMYLRLR